MKKPIWPDEKESRIRDLTFRPEGGKLATALGCDYDLMIRMEN